MPAQHAEVLIVGAGAAGLMTAITVGRSLRRAGERGRGARVVLVDGAKTPGAKILVAGGGRCNVTHHAVDHRAYAGSSRNAIRNVLRRLPVADTIAFFESIGVQLKREDTGKLFPVTNKARTVLDALLGECDRLGVRRIHPWRVGEIEPAEDESDALTVRREDGPEDTFVASRVVLATGGQALPKSGSDGLGYTFARRLGHTTTGRIFPALVPLRTGKRSKWITELSGIATRAEVVVHAGSGKRIVGFTHDILCTHFGLSGPGILDVSRHLTDQRAEDPGATLVVNWLPGFSFERADQWLRGIGQQGVAGALREHVPDRLGRAIAGSAGVDPETPGHRLPRDARRRLAHALTGTEVDIVGDRGFTHAEVTAGGVPLSEVDIKTMASRKRAGLWLVGEVLDVDGRIGGFNFQWAWASGFVAGEAIAERLVSVPA